MSIKIKNENKTVVRQYINVHASLNVIFTRLWNFNCSCCWTTKRLLSYCLETKPPVKANGGGGWLENHPVAKLKTQGGFRSSYNKTPWVCAGALRDNLALDNTCWLNQMSWEGGARGASGAGRAALKSGLQLHHHYRLSLNNGRLAPLAPLAPLATPWGRVVSEVFTRSGTVRKWKVNITFG